MTRHVTNTLLYATILTALMAIILQYTKLGAIVFAVVSVALLVADRYVENEHLKAEAKSSVKTDLFFKSKRYLEWAICFWIGVGLMSIINVFKIVYDQNAVSYSWIMFGFSIIFILVSLALYLFRKK